MKRIFWFVLTNIAFMITISLVISIISLFVPEIRQINNNDNLQYIFLYSGIVGFTSAFISLLFSKTSAKWATKTVLIKENQYKNEMQRFLFETVKSQSNRLGIKMPEVGYYIDSSPNAFATGFSKNHALVSFSTGLLNSMTKDEIEAVAAHEMSHIYNGDMVTLTLIQGVVNTFIIAFSRIITNILSDRVHPAVAVLANIGLQIALGILSTPIVTYFSRQREFRADYGSAKLVGKNKMISALYRLDSLSRQEGILENKKTMSALGISDNSEKTSIFSTHPSIRSRIDALQKT